jgi:flavin-dependent dehydrogenase
VIDVAIIGGGPAGAAAAVTAARAGLRTVIFDRGGEAVLDPDVAEHEAEESIGSDCVARLRNFGVDCEIAGAPYAGIVVGSKRTIFAGRWAVCGRHLRRSWLDEALRRAARDAGAELRRGVNIIDAEPAPGSGFRLTTSAGMVDTRQLVDASGRNAWLARCLKLRRQRMSPPLIAWRDIVSRPVESGALAEFRPDPSGWTFLAPIEPGRVVRTRLDRAPPTSAESAARTETSRGYVATWRLVHPMAGPGWFIAGEPAAALDPAAGCGVAFALRSGSAAGAASAACMAAGALAPIIAARYHDALTAEFRECAESLTHHYDRLGIHVLRGRQAMSL